MRLIQLSSFVSRRGTPSGIHYIMQLRIVADPFDESDAIQFRVHYFKLRRLMTINGSECLSVFIHKHFATIPTAHALHESKWSILEAIPTVQVLRRGETIPEPSGGLIYLKFHRSPAEPWIEVFVGRRRRCRRSGRIFIHRLFRWRNRAVRK